MTDDYFYEITHSLTHPEFCPKDGGKRTGQLVILAGSPSSGKTALSLNVLLNLSRQGIRTAFLTLEMTPMAIRRRLVALLADVPMQKIAARQFGEMTQNKLIEANAMLNGIPLEIIPAADRNIDRITTWLSRTQAQVVVIDHAGLILAPGGTRTEIVTQVANRIMGATVAANRLTILNSQLNREAAKSDRPPALHDLRDSGALEQDAHVVIALHCPQERRASERRQVSLHVLKNRDGKAAKFEVPPCFWTET